MYALQRDIPPRLMCLQPWYSEGRAQRWVTNGRSARRCRCWQKPDAGQSPHTVNRRSASGQSSKYVVFLNSIGWHGSVA